MALLGQPFLPCPAPSACRPSSSLGFGHGLAFALPHDPVSSCGGVKSSCAFSLRATLLGSATSVCCSSCLVCAGVVARRCAYPRIEAAARHGARKENAKVRNRRLQRKFDGTATKPRLSVFCSNRQLYAMLVDDHNKKILFYGSTLQKSICGDPPCSTTEAARRVGEEIIKACKELDISEISSYDRNGFARGEKMMAFEDPVAQHGFLPR